MINSTPRKDVAMGLGIAVQQGLLTYTQAEEIFSTIHRVCKETTPPDEVQTILKVANELINQHYE